MLLLLFFFFSSRRRHTRWTGDWSSDVCSSDLASKLCSHAADAPPPPLVPGSVDPLALSAIRSSDAEAGAESAPNAVHGASQPAATMASRANLIAVASLSP